MKILSVHNRYLQRGGEDVSREAEEELLRSHGHVVDTFEESNERIAELGSWATASRTVWSRESYRRMTDHLHHHRYDIVHVQNFFPLLSPSVHHAAHAAGVPVVQTLRNYRLLCVNGLLFRNGAPCERCIGHLPLPGVVHRCYRGNVAASATVATMIAGHRLLGTWQTKVDLFITLTAFAKGVLVRGGLPEAKIAVKPNFVVPNPERSGRKGGYAVYVGRLSEEKGVDTLLEAWGELHSPPPLKIVGDGPLAPMVSSAARRLPSIEPLGRLPIEETQRWIEGADVLLFPTRCYETFGRVVAEAYAAGTPVIASRIGAVAELVDDGATGRLVRPGDAADLADKVEWMFDHPIERTAMSQRAYRRYREHYSAETSIVRLIELYRHAIDTAQPTSDPS